MTRSNFLLTVPQGLFDAVADEMGQPFADSYLFGADLSGDRLMPRTLIGYHRMRDRTDFMALLKGLKLTLVPPPSPWPGDGTRLSAADAGRTVR